MCSTASVGTASFGIADSTATSADGPPVDAPSAITSVRATAAGPAAAPRPRGDCVGDSLPRGWVMTLIFATMRTAATKRASHSVLAAASLGLSSTSTAPADSASYVPNTLPRFSADDTIKIGVGAWAMICSVAASPSRSGSTRSSVMTSGRSVRASSSARLPSPASPMTANSPLATSNSTSRRRTVIESSTTTTRIIRHLRHRHRRPRVARSSRRAAPGRTGP